MILKGAVHKFGNDINTDDIIAAKYLVTTDDKELGRHCMENIAPDFVKQVTAGDILVAGRNFGCGSSREHAPRSLKGCGIAAVVAESFAGIFYRNAINVGLPFVELANTSEITPSDVIEIDLTGGMLKNITTNKTYRIEPFPPFLQQIIEYGGLMNWVKAKKQNTRSLK